MFVVLCLKPRTRGDPSSRASWLTSHSRSLWKKRERGSAALPQRTQMHLLCFCIAGHWVPMFHGHVLSFVCFSSLVFLAGSFGLVGFLVWFWFGFWFVSCGLAEHVCMQYVLCMLTLWRPAWFFFIDFVSRFRWFGPYLFFDRFRISASFTSNLITITFSFRVNIFQRFVGTIFPFPDIRFSSRAWAPSNAC